MTICLPSQKSKGYDYGKLFAKRSEKLGNEKIQRKPSPSHLSPSSPGHRMRGLKSKSKPSPTPTRNTTQIDRDPKKNAIDVAGSNIGNDNAHLDRMKGSVGAVRPANSTSNGSDSSQTSSAFTTNARKINEVYPDFSVEEAETLLQMHNNDVQKCLTIILENSVTHVRKYIAEAHARAVVQSLVVKDSTQGGFTPVDDQKTAKSLADEEKKKAYEAKMKRALQKGFLCYKHALSSSKRQRRYIYVTSDFKHFAWRALTKSKDAKTFAVSDIQRIENGVSFADDHLTVSLQLTTRPVNLEFEDQDTRDAFVEAFTWLLKATLDGRLY